jgi:hypothetical protein
MGFKAKVVHDYEPRDEDELCIKKGEIVTITDVNYGNAWWYGVATNGVQGFIPELYVERMRAPVIPQRPRLKPKPSQKSNSTDANLDLTRQKNMEMNGIVDEIDKIEASESNMDEARKTLKDKQRAELNEL